MIVWIIYIFSDRHPQLNNIFNGLLLWLAIFDNCFMVACLIENIWRHYGITYGNYVFDIAYCFILYPFKNFALTCITNTQIALSVERFKAIRCVSNMNILQKIRDYFTFDYTEILSKLIFFFYFIIFLFYNSTDIPLSIIATIPTDILDSNL